MWVALTATAFVIRSSRSRAAFHDLAGPAPLVLMTDRYSVYVHPPWETPPGLLGSHAE